MADYLDPQHVPAFHGPGRGPQQRKWAKLIDDLPADKVGRYVPESGQLPGNAMRMLRMTGARMGRPVQTWYVEPYIYFQEKES